MEIYESLIEKEDVETKVSDREILEKIFEMLESVSDYIVKKSETIDEGEIEEETKVEEDEGEIEIEEKEEEEN